MKPLLQKDKDAFISKQVEKLSKNPDLIFTRCIFIKEENEQNIKIYKQKITQTFGGGLLPLSIPLESPRECDYCDLNAYEAQAYNKWFNEVKNKKVRCSLEYVVKIS